MKKNTLINSSASYAVASMGHTDSLCVADAGLPIPNDHRRIDLAVSPGLPGMLEVLDALLAELVVERAVIAQETKDTSPAILEAIKMRLEGVPIEFVSHIQFKSMTEKCKAIVRTGECTPYANLILFSGVAF